MAVGKPIIASNVRGSRDLVDDGLTGYLIELKDHKKLQARIISLLKNSQTRKEFGDSARSKIEDYSLKNVVDEMSSIYKRIMSN